METQKFGLRAEKMAIDLLRAAGHRVQPGNCFEDKGLKIDFWVWSPKMARWLPIQFTVDKSAAVSWKGMDALKRGVIISWLPGEDLEVWAVRRGIDLQNELTTLFWNQIDGLLQGFGPKYLFGKWNQPWWQSLLPR